MQVMLMIHSNEANWIAMAAPEQDRMMGAYRAFSEALAKAGAMRSGERLMPASTAHTVRIEGGATRVLDGPYAETKEQLGGFFILDVPDMQAALRWAAQCPGAQHGVVELRALWQAPTA